MRDLQFHLDIGGSGEAATAFLAVYKLAEGYSLVVSARDDGDAEIHLSASDLALLQQLLSAMPSSVTAA